MADNEHGPVDEFDRMAGAVDAQAEQEMEQERRTGW